MLPLPRVRGQAWRPAPPMQAPMWGQAAAPFCRQCVGLKVWFFPLQCRMTINLSICPHQDASSSDRFPLPSQAPSAPSARVTRAENERTGVYAS